MTTTPTPEPAMVKETPGPTTGKKSPSRAAREGLSSKTASGVSLVIALLWTLPPFGLLVSSFRPESQAKGNGWWNVFTNPDFPLDNYREVLGGEGSASLTTFLVNSIVITIPGVLIPITLATLAAYAFAWMKFKGRDALFVAMFALQIVPIQVTLIPLLGFNAAARHLPYSTLGFLQYITPTLLLILAVWVFNEPFPADRQLAFICIWAGLAVYSYDAWRLMRNGPAA